MKFTAIMFITFVIIVISSHAPSKAVTIRTTAVRGFGEVAEACALTELMPCLPAMTTGANPTKDCCDKMVEQKPCLCSYIKNPEYSAFVTNPKGLKVLEFCKIPVPTC